LQQNSIIVLDSSLERWYDLELLQPFRLQALITVVLDWLLVGWLSKTKMEGGQTQMWQLRRLGFTCRSRGSRIKKKTLISF